MELNSFIYIYVIVCLCVLFKTNFDVVLKLLHIICLCMSSFSVSQRRIPPNPLTHPWSQVQTKEVKHFTFCKKNNKKKGSKKNPKQNYSSTITELEKALTICTYGMTFSSTETGREMFLQNHTEGTVYSDKETLNDKIRGTLVLLLYVIILLLLYFTYSASWWFIPVTMLSK